MTALKILAYIGAMIGLGTVGIMFVFSAYYSDAVWKSLFAIYVSLSCFYGFWMTPTPPELAEKDE